MLPRIVNTSKKEIKFSLDKRWKAWFFARGQNGPDVDQIILCQIDYTYCVKYSFYFLIIFQFWVFKFN